MADANPAVPPPPAPPTPEPVATAPEPPEDKPLGEAGEKALKAERSRATAAEKQAREFADRLKQYEDAGKSAEQKQADQLAALSSERDTATVRALRYEVCAEKELPLAAARFLTGTTKADIEEAAEAFKALGVAATQKPATGLPPSPNAGRESRSPTAGVAAGRDMFAASAKK